MCEKLVETNVTELAKDKSTPVHCAAVNVQSIHVSVQCNES